MLSGRTWMIMTAVVGLAAAAGAESKLYVVTTTTDLKSIAEAVGGDRIKVESVGKGYENPHFVDAKPSHIVKLNKEDVFVKVGLDLEVWAQLLTDGARNAKIRPGAVGYVDASTGAEILELPTGKLDRSMGDIHAFGNPHYWLDPQNGKVVAHNIAEALKRVAPGDADVFDQNEKRFSAQLDEKLARWLQLMAPYQGTKVVTYHNSWPNFMHRFGLNVVDYLEPKPGVPPSPAHLASLIGKMNSEGVKVVIQEPYFDQKVGKFVAEKTGAKLLVLSPSVGGEEGINTYPDLFDRNLQKLLAAFKETGVEPKAPAEVKGGK